MMLGGIAVSPLMMEKVAIAQISYPQYGVTAQHEGGNCLPVRSEPNPNAFMVACVSNGSTLKPVVGERNGWIQLNSGNWTWKNSTSLKAVTVSTPPPNRTPASTAGFPIYGATVQSPAGCSYARKAPSTAGDLASDCLPNSTELKALIGQQGGWYQLSSGNWIFGGNVRVP
ncbi:hypothetical protein [[Limnothrix rosea] IAM M-220]|uniref:hypothetical protein n=1 Tax=[Limnothrix rosea] IAM M-220 TaxID=454133 RepID=UPI0011158C78|nr:hypothetical protein [[Limnothrix rosea] IAM M-220]